VIGDCLDLHQQENLSEVGEQFHFCLATVPWPRKYCDCYITVENLIGRVRTVIFFKTYSILNFFGPGFNLFLPWLSAS